MKIKSLKYSVKSGDFAELGFKIFRKVRRLCGAGFKIFRKVRRLCGAGGIR
jgi:hypothetical protein